MSVTDRHWSDAEQLPMFLDPADIVANVEDGTWMSADHIDDYTWKLDEAQNNGLADSITRHGVKMPIVLAPPGTATWWSDPERVTTANGHHRTAVAADLAIPLVPVVWDEADVFGDYALHGKDSFADDGWAWTGSGVDADDLWTDDDPDDDEW
jgi:hypothetical protein